MLFYLFIYFIPANVHNMMQTKWGESMHFFIIIYSWTLKLLMRTNEVVFQSVSMKYAHQNRFLLRIFPLCGINTSIYKAFLDLKPTDRHH